MKSLLLLNLIIGLILFSCKSRPMDPENYTETKIKFGSGGGFTGLYTHYQLLDNGDLFMQKEPDSTQQHLARIKRKMYKPLFAALDQIDQEAFRYQNPGNMTRYVEVQMGDTSYRASFAMQDSLAPQAVQDMYQQLMHLVPKE
ncbi:MAG: hypothetical protein AAFN10_09385 [Bacteroidota bacterium]